MVVNTFVWSLDEREMVIDGFGVFGLLFMNGRWVVIDFTPWPA